MIIERRKFLKGLGLIFGVAATGGLGGCIVQEQRDPAKYDLRREAGQDPVLSVVDKFKTVVPQKIELTSQMSLEKSAWPAGSARVFDSSFWALDERRIVILTKMPAKQLRGEWRAAVLVNGDRLATQKVVLKYARVSINENQLYPEHVANGTFELTVSGTRDIRLKLEKGFKVFFERFEEDGKNYEGFGSLGVLVFDVSPVIDSQIKDGEVKNKF